MIEKVSLIQSICFPKHKDLAKITYNSILPYIVYKEEWNNGYYKSKIFKSKIEYKYIDLNLDDYFEEKNKIKDCAAQSSIGK